MADETTRVHCYRGPDRSTRNSAGTLQGSRRRPFGHRAQNVNPIRQFRGVQELPGRQGNREDVRRQHFHLCVSSFVNVGIRLINFLTFVTLTAGLGAGVTEAVAVVCPMEVVKIRLQAQMHSLADPQEIPQYRNAGHAVYKIIREEGFRALYRGVSLTALRQATNQGAVGSR